jgi:uncharacterized Rossmann fold enzyme
MQFAEWEPVYEAILADFGYDRAADERARDRLAALLAGPGYDPAGLDIEGETVAIAGGADRLTRDCDLALAREADAVIAASDAATRLREHGVTVDCMVTDLDKAPDTARALTAAGTPVAVHAHGDNIPTLRSVVPDLDGDAVIPTTQARPVDGVDNFGGFTDGDRAAFLADSLGAGQLLFPGWNVEDPTVGAEKRRKLRWAERLLYWLARRRGEQFGVLDGRREALAAPESADRN